MDELEPPGMGLEPDCNTLTPREEKERGGRQKERAVEMVRHITNRMEQRERDGDKKPRDRHDFDSVQP